MGNMYEVHDIGQRFSASTVLNHLADHISAKYGEATHAGMLRRWASGVADGTIYAADIPHLLRNARTPHLLRSDFESSAILLDGELTANRPFTSRVPLSALRDKDVIRFDREPTRWRVQGTPRWLPALAAYSITFEGLGERTFPAGEAHIVTRYERTELAAMTVVQSGSTSGGKYAVRSADPSVSAYLEIGLSKSGGEAWIAQTLVDRDKMCDLHDDREQRITDAGWRPCAPVNLSHGDEFTIHRPNGDLDAARVVDHVEMLDTGSAMVHFADGGPSGFVLWVPGWRTFTRHARTTSAADDWAALAGQVGV